jgi:hypothetical protein
LPPDLPPNRGESEAICYYETRLRRDTA